MGPIFHKSFNGIGIRCHGYDWPVSIGQYHQFPVKVFYFAKRNTFVKYTNRTMNISDALI